MSKFQKRVKEAIKLGLNLNDQQIQEEYYLGQFISPWKQSNNKNNKQMGHRRADLRISGKNTIYKVSRFVIIEADGNQHDNPNNKWNDPDKLYTRAQKFNDQIDRDYWENLKVNEDGGIMIRIKEPIGYDEDPNTYYERLNRLLEKLQKPGYMSNIIQDAENKKAKGVIVSWDNEKFIITKSWPKPKYI